MFKFIATQDCRLVSTNNLRDFAEMHSLPYSHVKDLNCGRFKRYRGFISTHHTARKYRQRYMTVLVNPKENKREILGETVTAFARAHHLCASELYKLINGRKIMCRGWCLEHTLQLAQGAVAA